MAYKRDLSKPLAETFGPGDGKLMSKSQSNAPHSALIGAGLIGTAISAFIGKMGRDKMKASKAKRREKKDARQTKRQTKRNN